MGKVSQKERVVTAIINEILAGKRLPGSPLREMSIAKELGTSQAPVREALRELQGKGYVTHRPRFGSSVALFTAKELHQTYDIREALESFSIISYGFRLVESSEIREQLLTILSAFEKIKKLTSFADTDYRFHELIIVQSQNELMHTTWKQVMNQSRIASFFLSTHFELKDAVPIHTIIGGHLLSGNFDAAVEDLHLHYTELRTATLQKETLL